VAGAGTRVGSGGRYDNLTANFGRPEPAVGFVLDLDALIEVLLRKENKASGELEKRESPVLLDGDPATLFGEARRRRASGERILINTNQRTG